MVESSATFKQNGERMVVLLRKFANHVSDAANSLQAMHQRETFDIQIHDMIRRQSDGVQFTDVEYIAKRMADLREEIKRYQSRVLETKGIVLDAKKTRESAEKTLIEGRREAENLLHDTTKGKLIKEADLKRVITALKHLDSASYPLEIINSFLEYNDSEMLDMESRIVTHKSITRRDIELLWTVAESFKRQHVAFLKKDISYRSSK
ncbi:hypothetical protein BC936DRAFT_137005 [Jimgerdemannia flammicorona]|uniref:Uncharacterized protein n=1 Tax=Jimgerdemannia flammicorona TaxID=994334 RepID=A0A433CYA1_9FUNG|nr:hypothetical protein BC936DRAFT_137005 [Jimgerdemannia flammicorona]